MKSDFEVRAVPGELHVDLFYPDFFAEKQPFVDVGLMHVRATSCSIRVWFDGHANEWVVQAIGAYEDSDRVPEDKRQPWVAREVRIDGNTGDLDEWLGDQG